MQATVERYNKDKKYWLHYVSQHIHNFKPTLEETYEVLIAVIIYIFFFVKLFLIKLLLKAT
jgi:hypothetical protein